MTHSGCEVLWIRIPQRMIDVQRSDHAPAERAVCDGRFTQGMQDLSGPRVMLIRCIGEGDQRTRVEDVARTSDARNLQAGNGHSGRS